MLGTNEAEQLENVPRTPHESDIEFRIRYRSDSGNGFPGNPQWLADSETQDFAVEPA